MADTEESEGEGEVVVQKSSKKMLFFSILALFIGGAAGFYPTWAGLVFASESSVSPMSDDKDDGHLKVAFVPLDQMVISLGPNSKNKHLTFRAQLEVKPEYEAEVQRMIPRVVDVLNNYLRAVDPKDLEPAAALIRLRAQMLRRIDIVLGPNRVNDLLVMEFVLN